MGIIVGPEIGASFKLVRKIKGYVPAMHWIVVRPCHSLTREVMPVGQPRVAQILELWTVDGRPPEVISPFGLSFVVLAFAAVGEELGDTRFLKIQRMEEIEVMPLEPPGRFSWRWPSFSTIALDLALWALGEGVRPIFAEGQYTRRIARGVVHDNDRNFLLSTINYRPYDIVDLFAPLPIPPQESDEFLEGPSAKSTISYDR
ncbi:hypothetical protein MVLG_03273 [Microbotryum lychnidis-dioicae p1A1 Lamole]|uniref:Uncharacterized protein n=1 Tax=Microbotryum lychnidis-dioicae (strain p1A1 Lamole / MvSl-1064) TaxID=683840 RepID=U5H7Q1_USTV1|nr:hypothetical protein MVLG_03273 [Microbotryum lychnidis-dioicae p1A1 Lamole]|eukprot:KDE06365.1 hypothetical protein MVLG_03273 [Microbotryum lychnidis-dioicae p1A1 Lamole]